MQYQKINILIVGFLAATLLLSSGTPAAYPPTALIAGINPDEDLWVDSIFNAMTPDERLGQLFMIRAHSDKGPDHVASVEKLIRDYHVGGLCFFQGTPTRQVELTNQYQKLNKHIPLMIAIDGEWGLGMRLQNTISFPRQLTMGAIHDNDLIYKFGQEVARQCRRIGIHVNFAPVADVNNNAANPVINTRSFGEDRKNVTVKSYMYAKGMQDNGVMACAKHFPGHGDTDVDSHYDLPVIRHDRARLDSIELFPFREMFKQGIGSVMVAHLNVPALDSSANRPTTLSRYTVTELLRKELGFEGLAFTDALEMKGVTKHFKPGEVEAEALLAGNDVLVLPENMEAAFREIKRYLSEGRLTQEEVDLHIKRVLRAKYRLGLTNFSPITTEKLDEELNTPFAKTIKRNIYENALTLVRNHDSIVPIQNLQQDIAALSIGTESRPKFQWRLSMFKNVPASYVDKEIPDATKVRLLREFQSKKLVIISLHGMSAFAAKNYGLSESAIDLVNQLSKRTKVLLVVFGSPYSLKHFDKVSNVVVAYEDDDMAQEITADALFGATAIRGKLPVTASPVSQYGDGITTEAIFRMGYSTPENEGMRSEDLSKIDYLAQEAIDAGATPGCVVLAAKNGKIVYHKAFGHHTYSKTRAVQPNDIYDLASVTKIAGATLALMKLYDEQLITLSDPIGKYLPELAGTNKENLILRDILGHRAGLQPWLPFYRNTVEKTADGVQQKNGYYTQQPEPGYDIPVADQLYLRNDYPDSVWQEIVQSPLLPTRGYKYSDLGFYMIARIVHRITGQTLDTYLEEQFFCPMGLTHIGFNAWQRWEQDLVAPTEIDTYFRMQKVQCYVHDMGAAMIGGVSGHAGLFSNATDLAAVLQMMLNYGYYGGQRFLQPETVKAFTQRHPDSTRRGMGFDMKQTDSRMHQNTSIRLSNEAFGHDGFTGTSAWADPETGIVFVLLSNRTYPAQKNQSLTNLRTRQRMQSAICNAIISKPSDPEWVQAKTDAVDRVSDTDTGK